MGFDDLVDCSSFVSAAIGQVGYSAEEVGHAISKLSKMMSDYSYAEEYSNSSLVRSATIVKMSIVRKPLVKFDGTKNATFTVDNTKIDLDVLERNFGPLNKGWNIL